MSFQSSHLLSFKPLRFNLSDLWFQQEFKFISLQIFRSNPQIFNKTSNFSTRKLEYHHLSSLPDLQTELLVLPLKLGHHESKSTYQVGRWLSTRFSEPYLLTNIRAISNQIFDDHQLPSHQLPSHQHSSHPADPGYLRLSQAISDNLRIPKAILCLGHASPKFYKEESKLAK